MGFPFFCRMPTCSSVTRNILCLLSPFLTFVTFGGDGIRKAVVEKKNEQKEAPGNSDKGFPGAEGLPKMADYNPSFFFT